MFAALFIPDFSVEAVLRAEPVLREQAVAVLDGTPPLLQVCAANPRAREAGIERGMTRMQAEAGAVELRRRSAACEAAAHAALLDCAHAFSPRVEATALDAVVLDAHGLERLFGPAQKLARDLARRAFDLGLEANVAMAANPDAALHAARGFAGVTVIPAGEELARLGPLSLDVLFLGAEHAADAKTACAERDRYLQTFDRWGVRTFRALANLPEIAVTERLGQPGLALQQLARGAASRPLRPCLAALDFEESIELEYAVDLLEPLAFLLARLLEQLCARLAARSLATNELRLSLQLDRSATAALPADAPGVAPAALSSIHENEPAHTCKLTFPVPMLDAKVFLKLLQLELKARPPGAPVAKVTLQAEPVKPRYAQGGLFLPVTPEAERLELTLARIRGVVGENRAGSAEVLDTHRPDGFRMARFTAEKSTQPASPAAENSARPDAPAPTAFRRLRPPQRVTVDLRDGAPAWVYLHGARCQVVSAAGPWRTSGEWWNGQGRWARDEWDVALRLQQSVTLYRMFREMESGGWFVEGTFD